ncbi:MAG: hypothetical protein APR63_07515 [Desulfuromonas sp. SDB]|nr:MAG: hypothetical protein APR63_07515 [Desulfuromonas sp. SDB]
MRTRQTISEPICFEGIGIHSGKPAKITLTPRCSGGIRFIKDNVEIPADYRFADASLRSISLIKDNLHIMVVEHLLAALWICQISDLLIDVQGEEIPALDGSAMPFVEKIHQTTRKELGKVWERESVMHPIRVTRDESEIIYFPDSSESLIATVILSYPEPGIDDEVETLNLYSPDLSTELAPARTFAFCSWIEQLKQRQLIQGGSLNNAVVFDEQGKLLNEQGFRMGRECSRHKLLDLIGDMMLYPRRLTGRIISYKPGHALDLKFLRILAKETGNE